MERELFLAQYADTNDVLRDMCRIIEVSRDSAYQAVNMALVRRNWLLGRRIAEEKLRGGDRAEYGLEIIKKLSKELTDAYGKGFDRTNLYNFLKFYQCFPEIVDTACQLSPQILSWSHYRILLRVENEAARKWYEQEAYRQTWAVRTLQRNVETQYYFRLLSTPQTVQAENAKNSGDKERKMLIKPDFIVVNSVFKIFNPFSPHQCFVFCDLQSFFSVYYHDNNKLSSAIKEKY